MIVKLNLNLQQNVKSLYSKLNFTAIPGTSSFASYTSSSSSTTSRSECPKFYFFNFKAYKKTFPFSGHNFNSNRFHEYSMDYTHCLIINNHSIQMLNWAYRAILHIRNHPQLNLLKRRAPERKRRDNEAQRWDKSGVSANLPSDNPASGNSERW